MKSTALITRWIVLFLILAGLVAFTGCSGEQAREAVSGTVETLSGKKDMDRMKKMKEDLNVIQEQQKTRYKRLDDNSEAKP